MSTKKRTCAPCHYATGLCLTLLVFVGACSSRHPSDSELLKNFQTHRAEFEQLLQMYQADRELGRVAYTFTRPENPATVGVSQERIAAYRKLFAQLHLESGIEGYGEREQVWFHASSIGLSVSGSSKGFTYWTKTPPLVVNSLDNYHSSDGRSFTAYRHIEGNWYLYLDYED